MKLREIIYGFVQNYFSDILRDEFSFVGRKWPIITGAGFGLGMAYSNCQKDLNASICQKSKSCKSEEKK